MTGTGTGTGAGACAAYIATSTIGRSQRRDTRRWRGRRSQPLGLPWRIVMVAVVVVVVLVPTVPVALLMVLMMLER